MDADFIKYRAALVSIGALYEDHTAPLSPEMIESAKRIIKEREDRKRKLTETGSG